jgi:hypothetical protein
MTKFEEGNIFNHVLRGSAPYYKKWLLLGGKKTIVGAPLTN